MKWYWSAAPRRELTGKLVWKYQLSLQDVATIMKQPKCRIEKLVKHAAHGPEVVAKLNWVRKGRPPKSTLPRPNVRQIRKYTKRKTLLRQISMPLKARAMEIEQTDGVKMTYDDIKKLYHRGKLKKLKLRPPKGAGTRASVEQQQRMIKDMQKEIRKAKREGREIIQIDESVFQPNSQQDRAWAPVG